jgi:hypothetical protein
MSYDGLMPKLLLLALSLFALTLVVPLFVWGMSQSWRTAFNAWRQYATYMGCLYALGLLTWLGMGAPL